MAIYEKESLCNKYAIEKSCYLYNACPHPHTALVAGQIATQFLLCSRDDESNMEFNQSKSNLL